MEKRVIIRDITTVKDGLIMQQVNCQGVMGAGVALALLKKWYAVKGEYLTYCKGKTADELLGDLQEVVVSENVSVFNSFTQKYFGSNKSVKYTNEELLKVNLSRFDKVAKERGKRGYVPDHIGCGLANGNWDTIKEYILDETDLYICELG